MISRDTNLSSLRPGTTNTGCYKRNLIDIQIDKNVQTPRSMENCVVPMNTKHN